MANDDKKRFSATTPGKRFLKLAGMTASVAGNVAANKMKGLFASEEQKQKSQEQLYKEVGEQIAQTLGEMKGAIMKVGQIASQVKDLLPAEFAQSLESLQKNSPPMPFGLIKRQIQRELKLEPEQLFSHISEEPFAAASIGQVHRATTLDGREVIVKVQYPGVEESCDSDLKHLKRILKLGGLLKLSSDVIDEVFVEIRRNLLEELDYRLEAENLKSFREFHKNDPKIIIPEVIESLSSKKILTCVFEPGDHLDEMDDIKYPQPLRNELGARLFDAILRQVYIFHAVHSDPHPGNFAFRPDGSIVMYDFGSVKRCDPNVLSVRKELVNAAVSGQLELIDQLLTKLGVRPENTENIAASFYKEWLDIILPVFFSDIPTDFGNTDVHKKLVAKARNEGLKHLGSFQPSPENMLLDRVFSGHFWTMKALGSVVDMREPINKYMRKAS